MKQRNINYLKVKRVFQKFTSVNITDKNKCNDVKKYTIMWKR